MTAIAASTISASPRCPRVGGSGDAHRQQEDDEATALRPLDATRNPVDPTKRGDDQSNPGMATPMPANTQTVTVTQRPTATPSRPAVGVITLRGGITPKTFGPYTFRPGGYKFVFTQLGSNDGYPWSQSTSFIVSVSSQPGDSFAEPYELLVNASRRTGSNMMTKSGRLYVYVSSGDAPYVITFTPLH